MAVPSYNIDFEKLIQQLLGYLLRKEKRVSWIKACLKPVRSIYDYFLSYAQDVVYEIKWNGQTITLENLLQDKFGPGITIVTNQLNIGTLTIGQTPDLTGTIGTDGDGGLIGDGIVSTSEYSFTVNVPSSLIFSEVEMIGYINKYKMFGTTYIIEIV